MEEQGCKSKHSLRKERATGLADGPSESPGYMTVLYRNLTVSHVIFPVVTPLE